MHTTIQLSFLDPVEAPPPEPFDIHRYDRYLVAFSGGKDSIAAFLSLRDAGVPREKIELWHHDIDGREGSTLMDWPCIPAYCTAFAAAFGVPLYRSWRVGGFEREMLRDQTPTAPVAFERLDGTTDQAGGESAKVGTRRKFPQQSADLSVRWCSAYLKIDVMAAAIRNQPRFEGQRTLVVTGERAAESPCRAKYATLEPHRTDKRASTKLDRFIDHHRPIHARSEAEVWALLERYRINPPPPYRLGWGRVSCVGCIFGSDNQWASLRVVNPAQFGQIATYEEAFGWTIRRDGSITAAADRGTPYASINRHDLAAALSITWQELIILPTDVLWTLPAGAFGESAGPP